MIEVGIPKDIREFEPTLVGPLTTRKFVCLVAMAGLVYGAYAIQTALGMDPMKEPIFLVFAIPPMLIGWYKPFGMHFEKFIGKAYRENFQAPNKRKYQIENMWDEIIATEEKDKKRTSESSKKEKVKEPPRSKMPQELRAYK